MKNLLVQSALLWLALQVAFAQDPELGRRIYSENAPSVLLLYVKATDGHYIAQGSGFLIEGSRIVTNAHVANGGKVFIELGSARIPTNLEKVDTANDLAILSVDAEMTAKPLALAGGKPSPGDLIFAITNPEGLERTISQGVISANRELAGRRLIQISTPISHGSSGGPIFDRNGKVIGIAVGMLADGQNLNFAVPIELLIRLMSRGSSDESNLDSILDQIAAVQTQQSQEQYSADPNSDYQKKQGELEVLLNKGTDVAANNADALLKIARIAESVNTDIALTVAKRATEVRPTSDSYLTLAEILNTKYTWTQGDEKRDLMKEAEKAARSAIKGARAPTAIMLFRLGDILEDEGQFGEAESILGSSMSMTRTSPDSRELYFRAVRDMLLCEAGLNHPVEEKRWFNELEKNGQASAYDWHSHAQQLSAVKEYKAAGDAYSQAAAVLKSDWCSAGDAYQLATDADSALYAERQCIEKLTGVENSETTLAWAHQTIASILNDRGVYAEALSHAKEATSLDPSNAWAFYTEADSLNDLQRFNEAITAAKEALRLSDGKYSSMHFVLGTSYFHVENWDLARQSFEKAAELDPKDDTSAYNVGVCYARLDYLSDAARWYEEALRRNPSRSDRDDLRQRIERLRR
jgi:tetratricopeptide (TPR) repeat protein